MELLTIDISGNKSSQAIGAVLNNLTPHKVSVEKGLPSTCLRSIVHGALIFGDLLLYGQKAFFCKTTTSAHRKIVRNEVVPMDLSYIFLKQCYTLHFCITAVKND